jgi:glycosyltransferase involved in cell wall biosynthesis
MPLRLLCVSEGQPPMGPLGHRRIEAAVRSGADRRDDLDARFAELGDVGPVAQALTRGVPGLRALDLDLQIARWHAVHGARARALVAREIAAYRPDAMTVVSHAVAFGLGAAMRSTPTLLSVDATVWQVRAMELWRPLRRTTRFQLAPSLALERRAFGRAAKVLAWTEWALRGVQEACPHADAVVHHPGLDVELFSPAAGARAPRERLRVLFVGGRFAAKGGEDVLAAAEPLLGERLEIDVVTADPVPARPGVRVHQLTAGDPRLIELYRQADMFCLPSHGDACPWAVLEAMACGLPVIATRTGGIPDLVIEGETGLLVPPRDHAALRAALEKACSDAALRAAMGAAGRRRVETDYDSRRQTDRLIALVREVTAA